MARESQMNLEIKKRVQKLIRKVIELQENAPANISYTISWSGLSNTLSFTKFSCKDGVVDIILDDYCYPGQVINGITLDRFENTIAEEEKFKNA